MVRRLGSKDWDEFGGSGGVRNLIVSTDSTYRLEISLDYSLRGSFQFILICITTFNVTFFGMTEVAEYFKSNQM